MTPPPLANHGNYDHLAQHVRQVAGRAGRGGGHRHLSAGFRPPSSSTTAAVSPASARATAGWTSRGSRTPSFRAGRGRPREGHDLLRRRTRQPDEGARQGSCISMQGASPQLYALGHQGAVGGCSGAIAGRLGHPHDGLSARVEEFGGAFIYAMPDGAAVGRVRRRARLRGPDVRSAPGISAIQAASVHRRAPRRRQVWCDTAPRRCPRAAGTPFRACTSTARSSPATPADS